VGTTVENQIAIASIVSTDFLGKIQPIVNYDYFINPYVRTICKWCITYYEKYEEAPALMIQSIYDVEKHKLEPAESEIISALLSKLSADYVEGQITNVDLIFDNAVKYFNERDLSLRLEQATRLKDIGRYVEAKEVISAPSKLEAIESKWFTLSDRNIMAKVFDPERRALLTLPGVLGEAVGPLERGWLVGLLAGFKRGKTTAMMDITARAVTSHLNVAFFSLEMGEVALAERFYKRFTGLGSEDRYLYPVFDCQLNQLGTCTLPERINTIKIRTSKKDHIDKSNFRADYKVCTVCRGFDNFIPEVWYEEVSSPAFTHKEVNQKWKGFEMMFGGNSLQLICHPRFSADVDDLRKDLLYLERRLDFLPDVIVVDYANILRPGKGMHKEDHKAIDDIWKALAGLAAERHCLCLTACQGNRASLKKQVHEEEDIADWIGVLGHADVFMAANQTPSEKKKGLIRFSFLGHRHKKFIPEEEIIVLQHLETAQMFLDSEYSN